MQKKFNHSHEIHLYTIDLNREQHHVAACFNLLNEDEKQRARTFKQAHHQRRFIIARAALRSLLSHYLPKQPPAVLKLSYGPHKKPQLSAAYHSSLQFNLSHSEDYALLAVTAEHPLGIDIELLKSHQCLHIAKRFFRADEYQFLAALPLQQAEPLFYALWTRKEAIIKAAGLSLAKNLPHLALLNYQSTVDNPIFNQPITLSTPDQSAQWWSMDLDPYISFDCSIASYKAAIATNRDIRPDDIVSEQYML